MKEKATPSVARFEKACNLLSDEDKSVFTGGVSDKVINLEQTKIGLPITGTYREFLRKFGSQEDSGFQGIDLKWNNSLFDRCEVHWKFGLPKDHIHVFMETHECFSLNTSEPTEEGEYMVYSYLLFPYGDLEPFARSFGELFERRFGLKKLLDSPKNTKKIQRKTGKKRF